MHKNYLQATKVVRLCLLKPHKFAQEHQAIAMLKKVDFEKVLDQKFWRRRKKRASVVVFRLRQSKFFVRLRSRCCTVACYKQVLSLRCKGRTYVESCNVKMLESFRFQSFKFQVCVLMQSF